MMTKTIDGGTLVLLLLTILSWLLIAVNLSNVAGQSATGDASVGKAMSTVAALAFIVLTWLLMAGLLLRAGAQGVLPAWSGAVAMILYFASGASAIAAVFLLDDPKLIWPAAIPLAPPALIIGYLVSLYQPSLNDAMARPIVGGWVWGAVLLASLAPWSAVFRVQERSAQARMQAEQLRAEHAQAAREVRRQEGLASIGRMKPDSHVWEWISLLDRESGVQNEAAVAFSKNPNRQADLEYWLGESMAAMEVVAELDLEPTPKLCESAQQWCRKFASLIPSQSGQPSYYEEKQLLGPSMAGLRWFRANGCALEDGIVAIEAGLRTYRDTPHRKRMLEELSSLRK